MASVSAITIPTATHRAILSYSHSTVYIKTKDNLFHGVNLCREIRELHFLRFQYRCFFIARETFAYREGTRLRKKPSSLYPSVDNDDEKRKMVIEQHLLKFNAERWGLIEVDDIVFPYGFQDPRADKVANIWVFDLPNDRLVCHKPTGNEEVDLKCLWGHGERDEDEDDLFIPESFDLHQCPDLTNDVYQTEAVEAAASDPQEYFGVPNWNPQPSSFARRITLFLRSRLIGLNIQWRSLLRMRTYNDTVFLKFADAVVHFASFKIRVETFYDVTERTSELFNTPTWSDLLYWDPLPDFVSCNPDHKDIRIGHCDGVTIVLARSHLHTLEIAQNLFHTADLEERQAGMTILLLTVTHVALYRASTHGEMHTKPALLLNGIDYPSTRAVRWLVEAFHPAPVEEHPIQTRLPLELQDIVLGHVADSDGNLEAMRLSCVLDIGSDSLLKSTGKQLWERREIVGYYEGRGNGSEERAEEDETDVDQDDDEEVEEGEEERSVVYPPARDEGVEERIMFETGFSGLTFISSRFVEFKRAEKLKASLAEADQESD